MKQEIAQQAVKSAPPVSLTAFAWITSLTLDKWVAMATLAYIGLQAGYLIWKWWQDIKRKRK
jgi:hypothetical protein